MDDDLGRRAFLVGALAAAGAVGLAACSGSGSGDGAATTTTSSPGAPGAESESDEPALTPMPVLLLGEEYLLADVLALGVLPLASTATVADAGFIGVEHDTSTVQILENTDSDLEPLVSLGAEQVIAAQYVVDAVGESALAPFGALTVVPDGSTLDETVAILGEALGREAEADALLGRLEEARERARSDIPDQEVSVAAIYSGPSVAAFVDGPWIVPQTLLDAGCTLVPDASEPHDHNGRVYLSLENLDLIAGPTLILLVSEAVEGEPAAIAQLTSDPLWTELPAPAAGRVFEMDRLAYPGVEGYERMVDDLIEILGE